MPWVWSGTPVDGLQGYISPVTALAVDLVSVMSQAVILLVERCLQVLWSMRDRRRPRLAGSEERLIPSKAHWRTDSLGSSRSIMARRWDRLTTRSSVTKNPVPP